MPQQPKITGDAQVDSWSLQVTQELNNTTSAGGVGGGSVPIVERLPNEIGEIGELVSLILADGANNPGVYRRIANTLTDNDWAAVGLSSVDIVSELPNTTGEIGELVSLTSVDGDYGADVYRRIANDSADSDWALVGRANAPFNAPFPEVVTLTTRVTYRLAFMADRVGTTRGDVWGYAGAPTLIGFDYGSGALGTTTVPSVGSPADTTVNRYDGTDDPTLNPGDTIDFGDVTLTLPTETQWIDLVNNTDGNATNQGWAFWTGTGETNRGNQFGFSIPHPAIANTGNPLEENAVLRTHPYVPIAASSTSIQLVITSRSDPDWPQIIVNYTPSTNQAWNSYNTDNRASFVWSNNGDEAIGGISGGISGSAGGGSIREDTARFVEDDIYDVTVRVNSTYDATNQNYPAASAPARDWVPAGTSSLVYTQGNVGIGTDNPAVALDVAGTINARGGIIDGTRIVETITFPEAETNHSIDLSVLDPQDRDMYEMTVQLTNNTGNNFSYGRNLITFSNGSWEFQSWLSSTTAVLAIQNLSGVDHNRITNVVANGENIIVTRAAANPVGNESFLSYRIEPMFTF